LNGDGAEWGREVISIAVMSGSGRDRVNDWAIKITNLNISLHNVYKILIVYFIIMFVTLRNHILYNQCGVSRSVIP